MNEQPFSSLGVHAPRNDHLTLSEKGFCRQRGDMWRFDSASSWTCLISRLAASRHRGPPRCSQTTTSCATLTDSNSLTSITRTSRGDDRRRNCFPRMKRDGSRRISPSCRSYCARHKSDSGVGQKISPYILSRPSLRPTRQTHTHSTTVQHRKQ